MSKHNLIKNTLYVMILVFLGRLMGFIREAIIASRFGTSFSSDLYAFSLGIHEMFFSSLGGAIGILFIPKLAEYIENGDKQDTVYFVNNTLNIIVTTGLLLGLLGIFFSKNIILLSAPGFATNYSAEDFKLAINMTRLVFLSSTLISLQYFLTAVLQSHKEFIIPGYIPILYNMVVILYVVFGMKYFGISGLIFSLTVAYVVEVVAQVPKYRRLGYKYRFIINLKDKNIKMLGILAIPVIVGTSISQLNFFISRMLASTLGEGMMATMNYANKLNLLIYSVVGTTIASIIYSSFSTLSAKKDVKGQKILLERVINTTNLIMIPAAIGLVILRVPLIDLVFRRGAFTESDVKLTAVVLLCYAPSMVAYSIRDILNRFFYSIKDTKTPAINSIISVIVNIILSVYLIKIMRLAGLALSTTISSILTTVLLMLSLAKKVKFNLKNILNSFKKTCFASIVMGLCVYLVHYILVTYLTSTKYRNVIDLSICSLVGICVYILIISLLKIEEYMSIFNSIKQKILKN